MEIDQIFYKAKDGRLFTDPLLCEEYEKTIGIIPGSIADMVQYVKDNAGDSKYVAGAVYFCWPDGRRTFNVLSNVCIDDCLESFVNVKDLREEQRYAATTMEEFLAYYDKEEKRDFPCQFLLAVSKEISMNIISIFSNGNNPNVWDKKKKEK